MNLHHFRARRIAPLSVLRAVFGLAALFTLLSASHAQDPTPTDNEINSLPSDPVVARVEMKLGAGESADTIEKGDLLTVLEDRGEKYVIQTFSGRKGIVAKTNAVLLPESTDIYTELIQSNPNDGRLYTLRASAWWALGDGAKALADFDQAITNGYDSAHAYSSRGLFHAATGNVDKAIADFGIAIEKNPEDLSGFINRAAAYIAIEEFAQAIKDYDAAIRLKPKNAALYQQRAIAKKLAGDLDAAVQDFNFVLQLEPKSIPALLGRGFIFFQQQQHAKAIEDFTQVIAVNPEAAVAFNNRGHNHQQLGQFREAIADYTEAIRLAPTYGLAHQNLAWILATVEDERLRDAKRAIDAANQACQLSEFKNVSDLAALAAALAADGQFELAAEWQAKVVAAADPTQREYTQKILDRYRTNLPFDSSLIPKLGVEGQETTKK